MRRIEINLSDPFEKVLACVLALPPGTRDLAGDGSGADQEFKQMVRELYEAANGRQVETAFGWIAIAPPVADFLKARPYCIETQIDLLIEAATRLICGAHRAGIEMAAIETAPTTRSGDRYLPGRAASSNGRINAPLRPAEKARSRTKLRKSPESSGNIQARPFKKYDTTK